MVAKRETHQKELCGLWNSKRCSQFLFSISRGSLLRFVLVWFIAGNDLNLLVQIFFNISYKSMCLLLFWVLNYWNVGAVFGFRVCLLFTCRRIEPRYCSSKNDWQYQNYIQGSHHTFLQEQNELERRSWQDSSFSCWYLTVIKTARLVWLVSSALQHFIFIGCFRNLIRNRS